jgi:hypothetical protein
MHRNRESHNRTATAVDVMTAVDSKQKPTVPLNNPAEFLT